MSYILDALRKADAQRERDPARGIHAQPLQTPPLERPVGHQTRLWLWGTAALGAGLLVVAAWQLAGPAALPVAVPVAYSPVAEPVAEPVTSPVPAVILPLPAPMTASAPPATVLLPVAPPPSPPPPRSAPTPVAAPSREAREPASAPAPATPASDRVLSANDLPAEVQRELPKLTISGGVYSDNPAQRMLIVNGQVLGEGAELAPGVVLEQIRARTAVLRYRGYRYAVAY